MLSRSGSALHAGPSFKKLKTQNTNAKTVQTENPKNHNSERRKSERLVLYNRGDSQQLSYSVDMIRTLTWGAMLPYHTAQALRFLAKITRETKAQATDQLGLIAERVMYHSVKLDSAARKIEWHHDVRIAHSAGESQIDILGIAPSGMICVEVKNWSGEVYGLPESPRWRVRYGSHEYLNWNPILQAKRQAGAIREITGLSANRTLTAIQLMNTERIDGPLSAEVNNLDHQVHHLLSLPKLEPEELWALKKRLFAARI